LQGVVIARPATLLEDAHRASCFPGGRAASLKITSPCAKMEKYSGRSDFIGIGTHRRCG
jgi:hypothetical protein